MMSGNAAYLYEKTEDGIRIFACTSLDHAAVIPEMIDGLPVTELAPYAFSERRIEHPEGNWTVCGEDSFLSGEELLPLSGERLEEIVLPASLRKIGNYAFYNCANLHSFTCHSTISDLGSGMLTGCNAVRQVELTIHTEEKSCMKELLSEMRQRVTVLYHSREGDAKLIFPEFYEEAVENTPARILWTQMHGSGHRYRYCFAGTEFHFREYDAVFGYARAQESVKQLLELGIGRLLHPLHLSVQAGEEYLQYAKEHWKETADYLVGQKDLTQLAEFVELSAPEEGQADILLQAAGQAGNAELSSYLLSYRQRHFTIKRKKFTL